MGNKLRTAGLNVARMNFSHGSYEYHQSVIDNVREAEKVQKGRQVAIALDTKGPEIRTGNTAGDIDIPIAAGTEINITTDEKYITACDDKNMYVDYKNITKVIEPGRIIYVEMESLRSMSCQLLTTRPSVPVLATTARSLPRRVSTSRTPMSISQLYPRRIKPISSLVSRIMSTWFSPHSSAVVRISSPSARFSAKRESTSRLSPRLRTDKVSTTLPRSSRRPMVSWLPVVIWVLKSQQPRCSLPRRR